MIDKSIRQHYANGKKGDPFYKDGEFQTFRQPTFFDPKDYPYKGVTQTGYKNVGVIGYPGDEKHEGNLTFKKDFRGNVRSDKGVAVGYKTPRTIHDQVYEGQGFEAGKKLISPSIDESGKNIQALKEKGTKYIDDKIKTLTPKNLLKKGTKKFVTSQVAKKLGLGSMFGLPGMLLGWLFDKAVAKVKGPTEEGIGFTSQQEEDFQDPDFGVGSSGNVSFAGIQYDKEHGAGAYNEMTTKRRISNIVKSGSTSQHAIDKINKLATKLPFEHEGSISTTKPITRTVSNPNEDRAREEKAAFDRAVAENAAKAAAEAAAQKAYAARVPDRIYGGGNGGGGGGGGGGQAAADAAGGSSYSSPFSKGGRIDKALGGRVRDI